jgi:MerR family transcriptional regulator, light-induced transcriptional regulator
MGWMDGHYPIRAVSRLTGLSIDTLRAWERRYRAIVPERSDRGRQYSHANVQRLILLRELVERGHAISQVAPLPDTELRGALATSQAVVRKSPPTVSIQEMVNLFANFEHTRANDELGRQAALLSPRDLVFGVVLPLLREVGERWHRGEIGIAQEHLVSSAVHHLLGSMVRLYPPRPGVPKIVIATLSGELHEFGIMAAAMIATFCGLNPLLLGPNLPAEELMGAARKTSASIVAVGCSGAPASSAALAELAAAVPEGAELWVGGPEPSWAVPGVFFLPDMEAFERLCIMSGTPTQ